MSHFNFPSWLQLSDVTSILLSYLAMQHINTVKTPLQADELNRGKVLFSYHINRCRKIRWNQNILSVEKTSFFKLTKRENEVQVHLCVFACSHASNGFLQVLLCVCVCVDWWPVYRVYPCSLHWPPKKVFNMNGRHLWPWGGLSIMLCVIFRINFIAIKLHGVQLSLA